MTVIVRKLKLLPTKAGSFVLLKADEYNLTRRMHLLNILLWFFAILAITSSINLFPQIDRNEEKEDLDNDNATTLQIVTAPVRDCPPGQKRLNGNCRKVFLPKGDDKNKDDTKNIV